MVLWYGLVVLQPRWLLKCNIPVEIDCREVLNGTGKCGVVPYDYCGILIAEHLDIWWGMFSTGSTFSRECTFRVYIPKEYTLYVLCTISGVKVLVGVYIRL